MSLFLNWKRKYIKINILCVEEFYTFISSYTTLAPRLGPADNLWNLCFHFHPSIARSTQCIPECRTVRCYLVHLVTVNYIFIVYARPTYNIYKLGLYITIWILKSVKLSEFELIPYVEIYSFSIKLIEKMWVKV